MASKLLSKFFEQIDLLEPNAEFLERAKHNLSESQLGHVFSCSMQEFHPEAGRRYDLIWIQWCIIYLTDEDLIRFLKLCQSCLNEQGLVSFRVIDRK